MKHLAKAPKGITIKQEVRFGRPVVAGTRIAVADILRLLQADYTLDEIPQQYQAVTPKIAKKALDYFQSNC